MECGMRHEGVGYACSAEQWIAAPIGECKIISIDHLWNVILLGQINLFLCLSPLCYANICSIQFPSIVPAALHLYSEFAIQYTILCSPFILTLHSMAPASLVFLMAHLFSHGSISFFIEYALNAENNARQRMAVELGQQLRDEIGLRALYKTAALLVLRVNINTHTRTHTHTPAHPLSLTLTLTHVRVKNSRLLIFIMISVAVECHKKAVDKRTALNEKLSLMP